MKKWAGALALISALGTLQLKPPTFPADLPAIEREAPAAKTVPVIIHYDEEMEQHHNGRLEEVIRLIVDHHNGSRRRILNEELVIEDMRPKDSNDRRSNGTYFLHKLIMEEPSDRMNIYFMGQQTFFYNRGNRIAFGGLAQTRGNAAIIWGARPIDHVATTVDHELYHLEGAYDLELPGGDSTYCVGKKRMTEDIDIGNLQLIKTVQRDGQSTAETQRMLKARIRHASSFFVNSHDLNHYIENLILQEHTVTNEEYAEALNNLLKDGVERNKGEFLKWTAQLDRHPRPPVLAENTAAAAAYWAADAAYKRGDLADAYQHIVLASRSYTGEDGRIEQVLYAAEEAIIEKMARGRELTGASTSLRSR